MPKRVYQPKIRHRQRTHGFRARMATASGRKVIKARRDRGRLRLATQPKHVKKLNWNAAKSPAGRPAKSTAKKSTARKSAVKRSPVKRSPAKKK